MTTKGTRLTRTEIASGEVTEYEWDHRNRLVRIVERTSASGSITQEIEYIYDAFDQRVGKRLDDDGNGTWDRDEVFVWTEGQTHLRLTDSDGEGTTETFHVASRYLYGDIVDHLLADEQFTDGAGPAADATTASTIAGETLWALVDHLGSVRDLVANGGVIREHVVYDSFGNRLVEQDYDSSGNTISSSHADAVDSLFGYTGRDWDAEAGLQCNRARWYDPATGRWLSQDPIGFEAGDANLYRYVGNQPTTLTDPSGLEERPGVPHSGETPEEFSERRTREETLRRLQEEEKQIWRRRFAELPVGSILDPLYLGDLALQDFHDWRFGTERSIEKRECSTPDQQIAVFHGMQWIGRPGGGGRWAHKIDDLVDGAKRPRKDVLNQSPATWGRTRLIKELHDNGFVLQGRTRTGGGLIYRHPTTCEQIRIMPRPNRGPFRGEPSAKFDGDYYYRYQPNPNLPEGPHVPLPNK